MPAKRKAGAGPAPSHGPGHKRARPEGESSSSGAGGDADPRPAFPFHVFISHAWGSPPAYDNHRRAKRLSEGLQRLGLRTWFDDDRMHGNTYDRMAEGIEGSAVVVVCVTREYMEKVAKHGNDNCKLEFHYAYNKRTILNMLPVVMEEGMAKPAEWSGSLGLKMSNELYYKLVSDEDVAFNEAVEKIAAAVRRKIDALLPSEIRAVASAMSSRGPSPAPSDDQSQVSTAPQSPPSRHVSPEVIAMHVSNDEISEFRDGMKALIQSFLEGGAGRSWKMHELLLVAFMRNNVAPSCNSDVTENLDVWDEKCQSADEDLVESFHQLMEGLLELDPKPAFFNDIAFHGDHMPKANYISAFVINWMSLSLLPAGLKSEWKEDVAKQWFDAGDSEAAEAFLERAESFLGKQVRGASWGAKILGKVIKTNSFVVVFSIDALAAILLREHWRLQSRHAHQEGAREGDSNTRLLAITLVVSSSSWHFAFAPAEGPGEAQMREIAGRLRRIASLPPQLVQPPECPMSEIDRVQVECLACQRETGSSFQLELHAQRRLARVSSGGGGGPNHPPTTQKVGGVLSAITGMFRSSPEKPAGQAAAGKTSGCQDEGQEKDRGKRQKENAWGISDVHRYTAAKDWAGNFVVLGATGSGKTTLIRFGNTLRTVFPAAIPQARRRV